MDTSMSKEAVFKILMSERLRQDQMHGATSHTPAEWILIMERCLNMAKAKWYSNDPMDDVMQEIMQVTAVGFAAIEEHGARQCKMF